jgi:hypothetical protein
VSGLFWKNNHELAFWELESEQQDNGKGKGQGKILNGSHVM